MRMYFGCARDDDLLDASDRIRRGINTLLVIKNGIIYGVVTPGSIALKFGVYAEYAVRDIIRNLLIFR